MNLNIFSQTEHLKKITNCGFPKLNDYKCFTNVKIEPSESHFEWKIAKNYNLFDPQLKSLAFMHLTKTKAFLVIKNDTILYEKYFYHTSKDSIFNSFSVAKTITSILVGIAIKEGFIQSIDDPISKYLKNYNFLNTKKGKNLTIKDLLTMTSGLSWSENFIDPLSDVVTAYYSDDLNPILNKLTISDKVGKKWKYQCGNTLILGLVIQAATNQPLTQFAENYLWKPLGASHYALWNTDKKNITKAFCCFYATARDFALLGYLLLNNGNINGKQILDTSYINQMITPYKKAKFKWHKVDFYGLHIWIYPKKKYNFYYMAGMFGQYVLIFPKEKLIVVRFGEMPNQLTIRRIPPDVENYASIGLNIFKIYENQK